MEMRFELKGLDCPNCAAKIEQEAKKLPGVAAAQVNLLQQTITLTCREADAQLEEQLTALVHRYEPEVTVARIPEKTATRIFILEGLDCPHCAEVIRSGAEKLTGVAAAQMNLMSQTLTLTMGGENSGLLEQLREIVAAHEPHVVVKEKTIAAPIAERKKEQPETDPGVKTMILRLILGGALFLAGLLGGHLRWFPEVAQIGLLICAYCVLGYDVVFNAVRNICRGHVFDENFLMSLSSIGAFVIGEHPEAVAVMLLYQVGEFFQSMAVRRSRRSITALMDIRPDDAWVLRGSEGTLVAAETVAVGEMILVRPGERIPLDGVVVDGESLVDTAALTGESVPRRAAKGEPVLSGCINTTGVLTVKVSKSFGESTATKILELVENASARKAPAENFITVFARWYTPAVVILAALLAVLPPLLGLGSWTQWIHRSFVFLVVSCPCALVISVPLTYFGGIGAASRHGVLVKGGNILDALNHVGTVVMDKTGTLTEGVFRVRETLCAPNVEQARLLRCAALAERHSNHPIAESIRAAWGGEVAGKVTDYCEFPGQGVAATVGGSWLLAGNSKLMEAEGILYAPCEKPGTKVYVAENGEYLGCILISDAIKPDSREAMEALRRMGAKQLVMLTGDDASIAAAVAEELGLDGWHAQLLPQDKVRLLETLDGEKEPGKKLVFLGDGMNDAPVLARADIGVAMGALGSDAAIEAADVVLMTDEPGKLAEAMGLARQTRRIVTQNIVFALSVKALFLVLGALGVTGMWVAVFGDVGVAMLAVLNAMRMLKK